ncbi:unnamed protein product, partial [Polarella glacialis]
MEEGQPYPSLVPPGSGGYVAPPPMSAFTAAAADASSDMGFFPSASSSSVEAGGTSGVRAVAGQLSWSGAPPQSPRPELVVADAVQPDAVGHAEVSPEMPSASAEGEAPPAESRRPAPLESPVPLRDAKRLAWQEVTSPASTAGVTSDTGGATTATATTASGSEGSSRGNGRQSPLRSGKLRPVSPRTRMGDVLAGQYSPTRYPESCGRPSRMIGVAGNWLPARPASAASFSFTASSRGSGPLRVSRSSPGSPRPGAREALAASNECVAWLKYRQSDAHVEGEIDKMI